MATNALSLCPCPKRLGHLASLTGTLAALLVAKRTANKQGSYCDEKEETLSASVVVEEFKSAEKGIKILTANKQDLYCKIEEKEEGHVSLSRYDTESPTSQRRPLLFLHHNHYLRAVRGRCAVETICKESKRVRPPTNKIISKSINVKSSNERGIRWTCTAK